jgi:hypothetical protein
MSPAEDERGDGVGFVSMENALAIIGAALQALGFVTVLYELVSIPKHLKQFERRDVTIRPRPVVARTRVPSPTLTVEPPPSIEQRVGALEDSQRKSRERLDSISEELRQQVTADVDRLQRAVAADREYMDQKLERLILGTAIGNLRLRWIGLGLFLGGLVLTTWGAVAG